MDPISSQHICDFLTNSFQIHSSKVCVRFVDENFKTTSISYNELERLSNSLVGRILNFRTSQRKVVVLFLERSVELVISLVSVLLADCTFLPVDTSFPTDRIAFLLKDSGCFVVLSTKHTQGQIDAICDQLGIPILDVSSTIGLGSEHSNSLCRVNDEAYILYTSGSTGTPKGVVNTHTGMLNRLSWMKQALNVTPTDVVLQKTPYSFDVSIWEFFLPLISGSELILVHQNAHREIPFLVKVIRDLKVTILHFVPPMLALFLEEKEVTKCLSMRALVCSGQTLPIPLAVKFIETFSVGCLLYNFYGPTEASIDVSSYKIDPKIFLKAFEDPSKQGITSVPIGTPISNNELFILDGDMLLCQDNTIGELYIGGVQLAKGYLGDVKKTQQSFIETQYGRLFRTGDFAQRIRDPQDPSMFVFEFKGRIDHQVKIHGIRIELEEIEIAFHKVNQVKDAVVIGHERWNEERTICDQQLIGYITTHEDKLSHNEIVSSIRTELRNLLPIQYIPSHIFILERIPLTSNGKVDRNKLPLPSFKEQRIDEKCTPLELQLKNIWMRVLCNTMISIYDDFFAIGGESMIALSIISLARKENILVSVGDIYHLRTIHKIATRLNESIGLGNPLFDPSSPGPFQLLSQRDQITLKERFSLKEVDDVYPMTQLQRGMAFHSIVNPESFQYQVIMSIKVGTRFNEPVFLQNLENIMRRSRVLRTSFNFDSFSEPVQIVHPMNSTTMDLRHFYSVKTISEAGSKQMIRQKFSKLSMFRFDFERPPLFRIRIFKSNQFFYFLFAFHDSIMDGWSRAYFIKKLFKNIGDRESPKRSTRDPRTPRKLDYVNFVQFERNLLDNDKMKQFWQDELIRWKPTQPPHLHTNLPGHVSHGADRNFDLIVPVSAHLHHSLKKLSFQMNCSLKNILLSIHLLVFNSINKENQIVTGVVSNSRMEAEGSENVIGNHLNTIPFNISIQPSQSWRDFVAEIQRIELRCLEYRAYPSSLILRDLRSSLKDPQIRSIYQTAFNFTDFHHFRAFSTNKTNSRSLQLSELEFTDPFHFPFVVIFRVSEINGQLELIINYSISEYPNTEEIRLIARYYMHFIHQVIQEGPEIHLEDLLNSPELFSNYLQSRDLILASTEESRAVLSENSSEEFRAYVEQFLLSSFESLLGKRGLTLDSGLFELGGDSMNIIQLSSLCRKNGILLTASQILKEQSPRNMAKVSAPHVRTASDIKRGGDESYVPLLPIQWHFFHTIDRYQSDIHHWNSEGSCFLSKAVQIDSLQNAIERCVQIHDGMRLKLKRKTSSHDPLSLFWKLYPYQPDQFFLFERVQVPFIQTVDGAFHPTISRKVKEFHLRMDLFRLPNFFFLLFCSESDDCRLLVMIGHHLLLDLVSIKIILNNIIQNCLSSKDHSSDIQDQQICSVQEWSQYLEQWIPSVEEMNFWAITNDLGRQIFPFDFNWNEQDPNQNTVSSTRTCSIEFEIFEENYGLSKIRNILLTALICSFEDWKPFALKNKYLTIEFINHGRDQHNSMFNLCSTIGEIAVLFPLSFELSHQSLGERLTDVEDHLESIPSTISYLKLAQMGKLTTKPSDIFFNFMGKFVLEGSFATFLREDIGPCIPQMGKRSSLFDIEAYLIDQRMIIEWSYSTDLFREDTIEALLKSMAKAYQKLVSFDSSIDKR